MEPLVSIVTPSYNQGEFIERTILSVKKQDYPRIEHIVMDGRSTDNTLDILRKYEGSLSWKSGPDRGQSDAINKGFLLCRGEIVAWLNSDDTYQPSAVRRAVHFLSEHSDVGLTYGDCWIIDENDKVIGRWVDRLDWDLDLITNKALNFIPQPAVFFRREVFDKVGPLDVGLQMAMDYDYWIRVGQRFKVKRMPGVLANFRLSPDSKSVASWSKFWPEVLSVLTKHCGVRPIPWYFRRYYGAAREHGYDSLEAFSLLEQAISEWTLLEPYHTAIRTKGLAQAFMEKARHEYLLNCRRSGLRHLVGSLRSNYGLIGSREWLVLGTKLLLGRWAVQGLKGMLVLKAAGARNDQH